MKLSDLKPHYGSRKKRTRSGRGESSGLGKTSGRGNKGQLARSGKKISPLFEGGQMPTSRRIPKFGFTNLFRKEFSIINLKDLSCFESGETVDLKTFQDKGLVKGGEKIKVKILGNGELKKNLIVKAQGFSKKASEAIVAAGGKAEVLK